MVWGNTNGRQHAHPHPSAAQYQNRVYDAALRTFTVPRPRHRGQFLDHDTRGRERQKNATLMGSLRV